MDLSARSQRLLCLAALLPLLALLFTATARAASPGFTPALTISSSISTSDPVQTGRLFRDGVDSTCETPNVVTAFDSTPKHYKSFPLNSLINEPACLELESSAPTCTPNFIQSAIYNGAFLPAEIATNLVTAEGTSPAPTNTYRVASQAGQKLVLAVNAVNEGQGCAEFTIQVNADRPWATSPPLVLAGGSDATGKPIAFGTPLSAGAATWGSGVSHAYQWQACDANGNGCANVPGATAASFSPGAAQVGHTVRVIDSATDPTIAKTSSSTSAVTGAVGKASNVVVLGKFTRNKKKGTGSLQVTLPGAGTLTLTGKGVKTAQATATAAGTLALPVKATGKTWKHLKAKGKAKVTVSVAFAPVGGDLASLSRHLLLRRKLAGH